MNCYKDEYQKMRKLNDQYQLSNQLFCLLPEDVLSLKICEEEKDVLNDVSSLTLRGPDIVDCVEDKEIITFNEDDFGN